MTKITRVIKRETGSVDRLRPVTAELHPFFLRIGVKGTREFYRVPWDHILGHARFLAARDVMRQKAAARRQVVQQGRLYGS